MSPLILVVFKRMFCYSAPTFMYSLSERNWIIFHSRINIFVAFRWYFIRYFLLFFICHFPNRLLHRALIRNYLDFCVKILVVCSSTIIAYVYISPPRSVHIFTVYDAYMMHISKDSGIMW